MDAIQGPCHNVCRRGGLRRSIPCRFTGVQYDPGGVVPGLKAMMRDGFSSGNQQELPRRALVFLAFYLLARPRSRTGDFSRFMLLVLQSTSGSAEAKWRS